MIEKIANVAAGLFFGFMLTGVAAFIIILVVGAIKWAWELVF